VAGADRAAGETALCIWCRGDRWLRVAVNAGGRVGGVCAVFVCGNHAGGSGRGFVGAATVAIAMSSPGVVPRRDTLTALDTAVTGIGPLAYGLATTNHAVTAVGGVAVAAVVTCVMLERYVVAAIVGGVLWVAQVALATARPRRSPAADSTAVIIGACSAFHYVTTINLRYAAARSRRQPPAAARSGGPYPPVSPQPPAAARSRPQRRAEPTSVPAAESAAARRCPYPPVPPPVRPPAPAGTRRRGRWRCAEQSSRCATSCPP
jgi:hypothetical protein